MESVLKSLVENLEGSSISAIILIILAFMFMFKKEIPTWVNRLFSLKNRLRIEDLKHQVVSMLLEEKIMKFDATHGAKAYSYFGTIVKRWLINYNNKNYKKLKRIGSFDDIEESYEKQKVSDLNGLTLKQFLDIWVAKTDNELDTLFPKPSEKRIADDMI